MRIILFLFSLFFIAFYVSAQRGTSMSKNIYTEVSNDQFAFLSMKDKSEDISISNDIYQKNNKEVSKNNKYKELDKFIIQIEESKVLPVEESSLFADKNTNPINSISLFGRKYTELKDTEVIYLKGKQIDYEIEKQKKDDELLKQKRYWARKRQKFGTPTLNNNQNTTQIDFNEDWNRIKESNTELKKYLRDFIRKQPKVKDVSKKYAKEIDPNLVAKKQVENILRLNAILSQEILGILSPSENTQKNSSLNDLRKYNVELRTMFSPYGLDKISDVEHYKNLSDLISINNNLKAKLVVLIDDKFDQQKMEEYFRASQILINFASN